MTKPTDFLFTGSKTAMKTVVLAHGAGAGMDTPFMTFFAEGLAAGGLRIVRFEFPYMAERRRTGKKRPPDREPVLRATWLTVIEQIGAKNLVIGGKSMGGRIASMVADDAGAAGLVCLGYPFHPTGKPEKLRVDHLHDLKTPTLTIIPRMRSMSRKFGQRDYVVFGYVPLEHRAGKRGQKRLNLSTFDHPSCNH